MSHMQTCLLQAEKGDFGGDLMKTRTTASKWFKAKMEALDGGRTHVKTKARRTLKKPGQCLTGNASLATMQNMLDQYDKAVESAKALGATIKSWTVSDFQAQVSALFAAIAEVESAASALNGAYAHTCEVRDALKKQQSKANRTKGTEFRKSVKAFTNKGWTTNWSGKFKDIGLVPRPDDVEQSVWPSYTFSFDCPSGDEKLTKFDRPMFFDLGDVCQPGHLVIGCVRLVYVICPS